jgi:hypothetical protein
MINASGERDMIATLFRRVRFCDRQTSQGVTGQRRCKDRYGHIHGERREDFDYKVSEKIDSDKEDIRKIKIPFMGVWIETDTVRMMAAYPTAICRQQASMST